MSEQSPEDKIVQTFHRALLRCKQCGNGTCVDCQIDIANWKKAFPELHKKLIYEAMANVITAGEALYSDKNAMVDSIIKEYLTSTPPDDAPESVGSSRMD